MPRKGYGSMTLGIQTQADLDYLMEKYQLKTRPDVIRFMIKQELKKIKCRLREFARQFLNRGVAV